MKPRLVKCPQCGNLAEYRTDNPARPFCSERCKLIDLGAWAEERYSIAGAPILDGPSTTALDAGEDDGVVGEYGSLPPSRSRSSRLDS
ncbi:MAG: DNA gyrase inhibitor YacG [Betaproteobacteria bacterium]